MIILKRYVLRELLGPTLLGLLFFTFLLFVTQIFKLTDILLSDGVNPVLVGNFALCLLPSLLSFTIPCSILVGVLISFGRLATDNEILAMRTSGVHLITIFKPIIHVGFFVSVLMLILNYAALPSLTLKSNDYIYQIEFQLFNTLKPGRFYEDLGSDNAEITFYFGEREEKTGDLKHIHMKIVASEEQLTGEKKKDKKPPTETLLIAERGKISVDKDTRTIRFHFFNGSLHPIEKDDPTQNNVIFFKELVRNINPSLSRMKGGVYQKKNKEMTVPELVANVELNRHKSPKAANESRVALWQRFSNPLACLAFVLIGMPLAVYIRPSGKSSGFAISFALLFVYYVLMKWGSSLGKVNHPMTPLAVFSPNLVLGCLGGMLIYFQTLK
ncbi:MAG TPA: LptF/LptG family permease [Candidatus Sumerlaeia bacterium]|nr:LptF/LptG family permease [Candidatus Sumerlaeia bacterium]